MQLDLFDPFGAADLDVYSWGVEVIDWDLKRDEASGLLAVASKTLTIRKLFPVTGSAKTPARRRRLRGRRSPSGEGTRQTSSK